MTNRVPNHKAPKLSIIWFQRLICLFLEGPGLRGIRHAPTCGPHTSSDEPGTEPTPQELAETIEKINPLPHKVIFTEPQYSAKAAETIANETGAKIFELDPIVTGEAKPENLLDYPDRMLMNLMTLIKALQ